MSKENIKISKKKKNSKKSLSYKKTMEKINYFYKIIVDTIMSVEKYKTYDIITSSDLNICI